MAPVTHSSTIVDQINDLRRLVTTARKAALLPWLPVPLSPLFIPNGTVGDDFAYAAVPVANLPAETILYQGRIAVFYTRIRVAGTWGQSSGANTCVYRVKVDGVQVGTWSTGAALDTADKGPYDVSAYLGAGWHTITLTATPTGSGNVAVQLDSVHQCPST